MIPNYELESVYDFLCEQNEGSLEHNLKQFIKKFQSDSINLFNPCFLLVQAICDNVICSKQTITIAIRIFENVKQHPFLLTLLDICDQAVDQFEKKFIYELVFKKGRDQYGQMTLRTLLEEQDKYLDQFKNKEEMDQLKKILLENQQNMPIQAQNQIRNVVPDSIQIDKRNDAPDILPQFEKIKNLDKEFLGFELDMLRPVPEALMMLPDEEPYWIDTGVFSDVQWDYNISINNDTLSLIKELMQKAYQNPLNPEEFKILQNLFQKDSTLVLKCGLTPDLLPELVEKNAALASFVLVKMHSYPTITEYFEKLVTLEVTLSTLEVVNKLASTISLPKEFLHYFLTQCIMQCEQQKVFCLKTLFLQGQRELKSIGQISLCIHKGNDQTQKYQPQGTLYRSMISIFNYFRQLQAFCIEFSKISEASSLFKLLKQIDHEKQLPSQ